MWDRENLTLSMVSRIVIKRLGNCDLLGTHGVARGLLLIQCDRYGSNCNDFWAIAPQCYFLSLRFIFAAFFLRLTPSTALKQFSAT